MADTVKKVEETTVPVEAPVEAPQTDPGQQVEQDAYVPTYKVKPEFKQAVMQSIGDRPYNEIAGLIQAINVEIMDHNTLSQVIQVIGNFPYVRVEKLLDNVSSLVEQIVEED